MKVAMVSPYDWSFPGGVKTHIVGLRDALARKGIEVVVMAPSSKPEPDIFSTGKPIPIPANGSVARLCFSQRSYRKIKKRIGLGDIDVLHIHEPGSPSAGLLALIAARVPVVATFHASSEGNIGYAVARPVLNRFFSKLSERIVVSRAAKELVSRYFPHDYTQIPNGVDVSFFRDSKDDPSLQKLKPYVLFLGRPEPRKGFEILKNAMESVVKEMDVRLLVVGHTPQDPPDWMVSLGSVPYHRLPSIYANADVFCAPSLGGESFGIVLTEAMSSGTPVVCSDIPGYAEAAAGAAYLVPPGSPVRLADALIEVLADDAIKLDLVTKGRLRAAQVDWESLSEEVMDCYRRAL